MDNPIGKQVENYTIIGHIADGAYGSVFLARHKYIKERLAAIKFLRVSVPSEEEREYFYKEANILETLQHESILHVYDAGVDKEGFPYIVTEYASQGSLRNRLLRQSSLPLPYEEALDIIFRIGKALDYAHQKNIIHRDLKPENILFNNEGEALLADFGIAAILESSTTKPGEPKGTPAYMAPEQFDGDISTKCDQYALGCIAYELLTGRKPFVLAPGSHWLAWAYKHRTENPFGLKQINPKLPDHVEQAVLKALAKERNDRHKDVATFISNLQETKEQWLNEGNTNYKAKLFEKALVAFDNVIRIDPSEEKAVRGKGEVLYELKRYQEALDALEQVIFLNPNDSIAYSKKGMVLEALGRSQEALVIYDHAISLNPNDVTAFKGKGNVLYELKRYDKALAAYQTAIDLEPKDASSHANAGRSLKALRRYHESLNAHEKAIQLDTKNSFYHKYKGDTLRAIKLHGEALTSYKQAIQLNPSDPTAYNGVGRVLEDLNRFEEALAFYDQAIKINIDNPVYRRHKGDLHGRVSTPTHEKG